MSADACFVHIHMLFLARCLTSATLFTRVRRLSSGSIAGGVLSADACFVSTRMLLFA